MAESVDTVPSCNEAFESLEVALQWYKKQNECDSLQLLALKRLFDSKKRNKTAKQ